MPSAGWHRGVQTDDGRATKHVRCRGTSYRNGMATLAATARRWTLRFAPLPSMFSPAMLTPTSVKASVALQRIKLFRCHPRNCSARPQTRLCGIVTLCPYSTPSNDFSMSDKFYIPLQACLSQNRNFWDSRQLATHLQNRRILRGLANPSWPLARLFLTLRKAPASRRSCNRLSSSGCRLVT